MENELKKAAEIIKKSTNLISLTGAGISVESGIPDFRSRSGLWEKYDPAIYATIDAFRKIPEKSWEMLFELIDIASGAVPNPAHYALAELEKMRVLKAIITQNIDNLHQKAGSRNGVEYHGNATRLVCMKCGNYYEMTDFDLSERVIPRC